jgi:hypothetical protein
VKESVVGVDRETSLEVDMAAVDKIDPALEVELAESSTLDTPEVVEAVHQLVEDC